MIKITTKIESEKEYNRQRKDLSDIGVHIPEYKDLKNENRI
jgi:hypothetical protein